MDISPGPEAESPPACPKAHSYVKAAGDIQEESYPVEELDKKVVEVVAVVVERATALKQRLRRLSLGLRWRQDP